MLFSSPFHKNIGFSCQSNSTYDETKIFEQEWQLLSPKAVNKRKYQFFLGRLAAHKAMEQLNIKPSPVLKGNDNEPVWPPGLTGSITHTKNTAIAAVAKKKDNISGVGVDIEKITRKISWGIIDKICLPSEKVWVEQISQKSNIRLFMIFSAKETVYKTFFPIYKTFFGFHEVFLTWNEQKQSFDGKLLNKNIF